MRCRVDLVGRWPNLAEQARETLVAPPSAGS
jgi:hypothetical protein